MTLSVFPDVNVWLALSYPAHSHHPPALRWFQTLDDATVFYFCRTTQLSLFRLLTTEAVMSRDVFTQLQCWTLFDRWIGSRKARLAAEPSGLDSILRSCTNQGASSPKAWADAYLAAFAEAGGLTLVTFDRALASKSSGSVLLS